MVKISGSLVKKVEEVERTGRITYHIVGDNDHDVWLFFVEPSWRGAAAVHRTLQRQHAYDGGQNEFDATDARLVHDDDSRGSCTRTAIEIATAKQRTKRTCTDSRVLL